MVNCRKFKVWMREGGAAEKCDYFFAAPLHPCATRELITSHKEPHLSRSNSRVAGWHHGRMHLTLPPLPLFPYCPIDLVNSFSFS